MIFFELRMTQVGPRAFDSTPELSHNMALLERHGKLQYPDHFWGSINLNIRQYHLPKDLKHHPDCLQLNTKSENLLQFMIYYLLLLIVKTGVSNRIAIVQ